MPASTPHHDHRPHGEAVASTADLERATGEVETAARSRRRLVAPLAVLAGLSLAVGGAMLVPEQVDARGGEPQVSEPSVSAQSAPSRSVNPVTRSSQRPALTAQGARLAMRAAAATPTVKPTASATAKPTRKASKKATPTPTATATASSEPRETVRTPALGRVTATLYTTVGVNVRTAPDLSAAKATSLAPGSEVAATSVRVDGWRQVRVNGRAAYVRAAYLTSSKPVVRQEPTTSPESEKVSVKASSSARQPTGSRPGSTARSSQGSTARSNTRQASSTRSSSTGGSCSSYAVERGLTQNAINVHRGVCANFPSIQTFGGLRASADNHGSGRALDVMVSGDAGWAVARWARANASSLGITEVIYAQQIWTTQRADEGWRSMSDRGSATANHYDHVHISVR